MDMVGERGKGLDDVTLKGFIFFGHFEKPSLRINLTSKLTVKICL